MSSHSPDAGPRRRERDIFASESSTSTRLTLAKGASLDYRFGPVTGGTIFVTVDAQSLRPLPIRGAGKGSKGKAAPIGMGGVLGGGFGGGGVLDTGDGLPPIPPSQPIPQDVFQIDVFNSAGRTSGGGRAPLLTPAVPDRLGGVMAMPRPWRVQVTNTGTVDAMLTLQIHFVGNTPVFERPLDLDLLNHKFNILLNDLQPIRLQLNRRTETVQVGGHRITLTHTDFALDLHPEWALVHRELQGVHHSFTPGFMSESLVSQSLRLKACVVEDRPAVHVQVNMGASRVDLGDLVQAMIDKTGESLADLLPAVNLPEFSIHLYFVLRNEAVPGSVVRLVPSFDVRVRVETGGVPDGTSALLVAALEAAVKQGMNSFAVEKKLSHYAQAFLGWVLGDRHAVVQGTRATVSLNQVGTRPGPLLLSSDIGNEAQPPLNPGNLGKIDHIVVVMMENRSFDHMLGYLSLPTSGNAGRVGAGRINVDGLVGSESNPIDVRGGRIQVFPLTNKRLLEDPGHSFSFARTQRGNFGITYFDTPGGGMPNPPANVDAGEWIERFKEAHQREFRVGPNQGFVMAHARRLAGSYPTLGGAALVAARAAVMGYYTAAQLPTYHYLAENFGICDRWFAAHPGHTWPNRFISLTGALIAGPDGKPQFDNPSLDGFEPLATSTIFDHLSAANVPWRCYEHNFCFLRLFKKYTAEREHVRQYLPAPLLGEAGFAADVRSGRWMNAPSVTFIEPRLIDISPANANDDHPPADIGNGQRFIREVIDTLQARPEVWAKTLLLITYDENGGYHDHVHAPPGEVNPMFIDPLTQQPVTYRGFRVPAFVASPFVPARAVSHEVYDHTSILKTIMARFLAQSPPNMGPRVAAARDVGSMLELLRPRALNLRPPPVAAVRKKTLPPATLDDDDFRRFLSGFRDKFAPRV